jgi:hypothetical protein
MRGWSRPGAAGAGGILGRASGQVRGQRFSGNLIAFLTRVSGLSDPRESPVLISLASFYLLIKIAFLFGLVRTQIKFEPMQDRWLFLAILYTAGIALLSFLFLELTGVLNWAPWQVQLAQSLGVSPWVSWLGQTFLLSALYFWLITKFGDGALF